MLINEETLKGSVVLPLLHALGFESGDLAFETSFSIQLGRGVYNVRNEVSASANGRLDVLCRRNGSPFAVIELKAEGETLSDRDRLQGLSYARLLDPMAPFVLVSNGKDTRLYATLTGKQIDATSPGACEDLLPGLAEEIRLRREELYQFVGYSYDNLIRFCAAHNAAIMRPLTELAAPGISAPKVLDDAYVNRTAIEARYSRFLNEKSSVFPVIGDSGTGKTNLICFLISQASSEPYLFFAAGLLSHSFIADLAGAFNCAFSAHEDALRILKRIAAIAREKDRAVVIFLDGLDEWDAPDKTMQMAQLLSWCASLGIRLVVSCKTQAWPEFLSRNGISTPLAENLASDVPRLSDFDSVELELAAERYSRFFGVPAELHGGNWAVANPFAVRVAFEVAHATGGPANLVNPPRSTLSNYLALRLSTHPQGGRLRRYLEAIGRSLLIQSRSHLPESTIRADLGLALHEEIPEDLFRLDFLQRHTDVSGTPYVGFYYSIIRDHIVAILVLRLSGDVQTLRAEAPWLLAGEIGESVLHYVLRTGSPDEQTECINAAMCFDVNRGTATTARMLSWHGRWLYPSVIEGLRVPLLDHLVGCFRAATADVTVATQAIDAIAALSGVPAEHALTRCFEGLLDAPAEPWRFVSHQIASLLSRTNSPEVTAQLVELAQCDVPESGYVRRYIVESLTPRQGFDRQALFLALIADPDPNLRAWVQHWYEEIEDLALRNQLVRLLDTKHSTGATIDILTALGGSRLPDTVALLHGRLQLGRWSERTAGWALRAISHLDRNLVLPIIREALMLDPWTDVTRSALIAIQADRISETSGDLMAVLREQPSIIGGDSVWYVQALASVVSAGDMAELRRLAQSRESRTAAALAIAVLTAQGDSECDLLVMDFASDPEVAERDRQVVLDSWIGALPGRAIHRTESGDVIPSGCIDLGQDVLVQLFRLLKRNDTLAPTALAVLVNSNADIDEVCLHIIRVLPVMQAAYSNRLLALCCRERWHQLGHRLRPWLHQQLSGPGLNSIAAQNAFELLWMVADRSTLEIIQGARHTFETQFGKARLNELEHRVMQGRVPSIF